jgi:hypothetical protein
MRAHGPPMAWLGFFMGLVLFWAIIKALYTYWIYFFFLCILQFVCIITLRASDVQQLRKVVHVRTDMAFLASPREKGFGRTKNLPVEFRWLTLDIRLLLLSFFDPSQIMHLQIKSWNFL